MRTFEDGIGGVHRIDHLTGGGHRDHLVGRGGDPGGGDQHDLRHRRVVVAHSLSVPRPRRAERTDRPAGVRVAGDRRARADPGLRQQRLVRRSPQKHRRPGDLLGARHRARHLLRVAAPGRARAHPGTRRDRPRAGTGGPLAGRQRLAAALAADPAERPLGPRVRGRAEPGPGARGVRCGPGRGRQRAGIHPDDAAARRPALQRPRRERRLSHQLRDGRHRHPAASSWWRCCDRRTNTDRTSHGHSSTSTSASGSATSSPSTTSASMSAAAGSRRCSAPAAGGSRPCSG